MRWTNKDGTVMEISYSQVLQRQTMWILLFVAILLLIITATMFGVLWKIDSLNVLTKLMACN